MTHTRQPTPAQEAAALLADVQKQALRGIAGAMLGFTVVQLCLWHRNPIATRMTLSLSFD